MKTKIFTGLAMVCLFLTVKANTNNAKRVLANSTSAATLSALTKNVEYGFDRANVQDDYYANLDQLAKVMLKEDYAVSLKGYADEIGAYKYNWVLSDKRANSVKDYLVSKGVQQSRIITTPFGSTEPIASNQTEEGRQKNRRVEISLKKINE
ncbi:outer membrane protein OmpA-like peptidoglycan-associated protein [Pedobacter sp. UYP30]|uniref:OmpA family protein n=1 Tax=Pedobacter sp. UYP30 TaxID=1756400 RepID=UPI0033931B8B